MELPPVVYSGHALYFVRIKWCLFPDLWNTGADPRIRNNNGDKKMSDKVRLTLWDDLFAVHTPDRIKVRSMLHISNIHSF